MKRIIAALAGLTLAAASLMGCAPIGNLIYPPSERAIDAPVSAEEPTADMADNICTIIEHRGVGLGILDIHALGKQNGLSADKVARIIIAAVNERCPQYHDEIMEWAENSTARTQSASLLT